MKRSGLLLIIAVLLLSFAAAADDSGFIKNNSSSTLCAEEENINIHVYYQNLTKFRIIATHPTYLPTDVIDGGKNCTNCRRCPESVAIPTKIYDDGNVVVETVKETPWRRGGESMDVSVEGGKSSKGATYVRIYNTTFDPIDYPQVFVLYEDGTTRIIPKPPLDLGKVTFGLSVVIGPTENDVGRLTGIDSVKIDPLNLTADVIYKDMTSAQLKLQADRNENIVEVSNITYNTYDYPFAILSSMWVKDGNADVDHIKTAEGEVPIMGGWKELKGTWWEFFREEPSIHNTNGPDIRIEVVN